MTDTDPAQKTPPQAPIPEKWQTPETDPPKQEEGGGCLAAAGWLVAIIIGGFLLLLGTCLLSGR